MKIRETFINQTRGHIFGESEWYEPWTDDVGKLFRSMQKEYGRCASKVYVDTADGKAKACGWVFEKRMEYDDWRPDWHGERHYTREVWVHLADHVEHIPARDIVTEHELAAS